MTRDERMWYLKHIDLFKGISDSEILSIAETVGGKKCKKGELLYTPHDDTRTIHILKKGEVTLFHLHRGKKLIIDVLKPGAIFGNITFDSSSTDHFAEVTENAYMCVFSVEDFIKVLKAKPELMLQFLQIMSQRIAEYESRMKSNLFDAKEKIIHYLQLLDSKQQNRGFLQKIMSKNRKVTHEKLSEYTGLSRETVTRALQALKKNEVIYTDEKGVIRLVSHD